MSNIYAPRPKGKRCPKCGMSEHKPDQWCSGVKGKT